MEAIRSSETSVLNKIHTALQKTAFFIVTAVKISNLAQKQIYIPKRFLVEWRLLECYAVWLL
jgi:hypothetical protein